MKKNLLLTITCILSCVSAIYAQQTPLYKNPLVPTEKRVNDLLSRMTLEEKIAQIRQLHSWELFEGQNLNPSKLSKKCGDISYGLIECFSLTADNCRKSVREMQTYMVEKTRLGIPAFPIAESLHGVVQDGATIYPQNVAMGSTFNTDLAYEKTKHISGELNTLGIKQVLAPCIDVVRDLRWGRVEESFGEDPFLCSKMAVAEVKGYLEHGTSPMLKHYGPHGTPVGGLNLASVDCGTRDLFEVYMKPFEAVIAETGIMAVMSSYNSWNRVPNSASRFMLTDILRNKFGFRGYVYSDWGVIEMLKTFHKTAGNSYEAARQAITAGVDVEAASSCYPALIDQVKTREFDIQYINQAVKRILRAKFELGLFEDPYLEKSPYRIALRSTESVNLSRKIADESTVLLKNENNLLPLNADNLKSIAVIGPNADQVQFGDYSWSNKNEDGITPLKGITQLLGSKVKVNYAKGCSMSSLDTTGIAQAVEAARRSEVAIVFVGTTSAALVRHNPNPPTCGEGFDLSDLTLTGSQEQLIKEVHATGKPVIVVLVTGKPIAIPWLKKNIPAIFVQWYAGQEEGHSIADLLFGQVNPSGKLNFSFPQSTGHLPAYYNHLTTDKGFYKEPGSYEKPGRDYVFSNSDPLWAFGHGLSYTQFDYLSATTDQTSYTPNDTITVEVKLKNSGKRSGKEVIQVYVRDVVSSVMMPIRQLKGFTKIELSPGEVKEGEIKIPVRELYLTDDIGNRYFEAGKFEIQVGSASDQIRFNLPIQIGDSMESSTEIKPIGHSATTEGKIIQISGLVCDVQATPVPGVKVVAGSSKKSVLTDHKGNYTLKAKENEQLTFSKKGFITQKVNIEGQSHINIQFVQGE